MVRVDDLEFNGIAYVTVDKSGTWVWEVRPELKEVEGKLGWYLPEKYQGPGMTMLMEQTKGSVLPILLNGKDKELSRSWNRLYLEGNFQYSELFIIPKIWYRIPEQDDNNPNIEDYYGYGDLTFVYFY